MNICWIKIKKKKKENICTGIRNKYSRNLNEFVAAKQDFKVNWKVVFAVKRK